MDEVYEEIKEAGNYVVDGVEKTLTDAANYVEDVVAPAPVARTLDPAHPAPPPPPDEFEQRDGLGLSRRCVLKAPAAAEADKRWDYKKMYARRLVVQCPVLAVALYVAVAQFYDVEARLAPRAVPGPRLGLPRLVRRTSRQSVAINAAAQGWGSVSAAGPARLPHRAPGLQREALRHDGQRRPARALQPRAAGRLQLRPGAPLFSRAFCLSAARPRGLGSGRAELCGNQNFTARSS